jgi:hypothetical protein
MKINIHLWYLAELFVECKMFQTKVVEKIKTHFMLHTPPPPKIMSVFEVMCKNIVEPDWPQMTVWRMRIACSIIRLQTHTQSV